jgi:hypothetical protein
MLRACFRLSQRSDAWQRSPEDWIAPRANPFLQFRSLVSHLLDEYPVPGFMATVWLSEHGQPWELDLYLHLAKGRSIRQFVPWMPVAGRTSVRWAATRSLHDYS